MGKQHDTFPEEKPEMPEPKETPETSQPADPKEPEVPQENPQVVPDEIQPEVPAIDQPPSHGR